MLLEALSSAAARAAAGDQHSIAVIIPCFRVSRHVADVIGRVGPEVAAIYCVDDACPDGSGDHIEASLADPRVRVVRHDCNQGVGGATLTGYRAALADGHDILVKIDGDGQMDPALVRRFVQPIIDGTADYTKGNRFFFLENARGMPLARLVGNSALSFLTKLSSGYWNIFDPTNGYTAVHRSVAERLVRQRIDQRYFFESDMLLNLYLLRAVVQDVPMAAVYADERSNLSIRRVVLPFLFKNLRNIGRRFFVHYLIRDFSLVTLEVIVGILLLAFGIVAGASFWIGSFTSGEAATAGQVMIAALPILSGTQFILSALNYDIRNVPNLPRAASMDSDVVERNGGYPARLPELAKAHCR
ncbi:glycosyltransferase family 2 protein [Sphingomonas sp. LHG3443-2]|uniref:glycosyltransferase family 2 protein n=1 Tax=Sphingomonas sp. LHG3443-2 TaxID=2804639 RepID=UPI003CF6F470